MTRTSPFDQLVCSGGGLRCLWQGGWIEVVRDEIGLDPRRVAGVSGGAGTAAGFVARKGKAILDTLCDAFGSLDSNLDPHRIGEDGLTPHQSIYRDVIHDVFDPVTLREIAKGPSLQVLIAHPPSGTFAKLTGTAATAAYEAELHIIGSPHFNWAQKFGVTSSLIDARQAARDGTLADLICAAAVIPPVFEPPVWNGKTVIDGGMADQAPMPDPDDGETLVLLTRDYRKLPDIDRRTYVSPGKETAADKIDFTSPEKLRAAWAQGEADGRAFLKRYNRN